jgi:catechol 2,3-dioxygenase-like lactoylglutathione lyase family enzyme
MITGFHSIIYSDDAETTRAFFRDVLHWPSLDAGGGWLIFKTPPSELGVHPTTSDTNERWATTPFHQLSLMCDDLEATIADLRSAGVTVDAEVRDEGFGLVTSIEVPGAGSLMLYQPRHELAHQLDG